MAWPTTTDVNNLLTSAGITLPGGADVQGTIDATSAWIESTTNRTWTPVTQTRYYDGGQEYVFVDPCTAITSVVADNPDGTSGYPLTDWQALPKNSTPITRLFRTYLIPWPIGIENIAVTATYGEPSVPADLAKACLYLAASALLGAQGIRYAGGVLSVQMDIFAKTMAPQPYQALLDEWSEYVSRVLPLHTRYSLF